LSFLPWQGGLIDLARQNRLSSPWLSTIDAACRQLASRRDLRCGTTHALNPPHLRRAQAGPRASVELHPSHAAGVAAALQLRLLQPSESWLHPRPSPRAHPTSSPLAAETAAECGRVALRSAQDVLVLSLAKTIVLSGLVLSARPKGRRHGSVRPSNVDQVRPLSRPGGAWARPRRVQPSDQPSGERPSEMPDRASGTAAAAEQLAFWAWVHCRGAASGSRGRPARA
jgi:hypothetical protein